MALVKRGDKGAPLTAAEFDGNMDHFSDPENISVSWREGAAARSLVAKGNDFASVLDFGAVGDNVTDNTAAIQAAVDAEVPIYFPPGRYRVQSPVYFDKYLCFIGQGGFQGGPDDSKAMIVGNFDRPMIWQARDKDPVTYPPVCNGPDGSWGYYDAQGDFVTDLDATVDQVWSHYRYIHLNNMTFVQGGPQGECLHVHQSLAPSTIQNCTFSTYYRGVMWRCINAAPIFNNRFIGVSVGQFSGLLQGAWEQAEIIDSEHYEYNMNNAFSQMYGFRGNGAIIGCDAKGLGVGFHLAGEHNQFTGNRIEACSWGLWLGQVPTVSEFGDLVNETPYNRAQVSSSAFELNRRHIFLDNVGDAVSLQDISYRCQGETSDEIALLINRVGKATKISNLRWSGTPRFGVVVQKDLSCNISNVGGGGGVCTTNFFLTNGNISGTKVERIGINPAENSALEDAVRQATTYIPDLSLRGLTAPNIRDANTYAKNLGGMEPVANAATSVIVAFEGAYKRGNDLAAGRGARFIDVTAQADANSTLTPGTYYYAITVLTKHGETGISPTSATDTTQRSVVVAAGESVLVQWKNWPGLSDLGHKIRVYRGPQENRFYGYWQFDAADVTSTQSFTDDGGFSTPAFDARGSTAQNPEIPTKHEDDANYAIVATPSWQTDVWVNAKTTSGFTINFGTAAPDANQTVQWLLFRP